MREVSTLDTAATRAQSDPPHPGAAAPSEDLQALWFALASQQWQTLALVPATPALDLGALAAELADAAIRSGTRLAVLDARQVTLDGVGVLLEAVKAQAPQPGRALVMLGDLALRPAGRALVDASDAALLFVPMGTARRARLQELVRVCGRSRLLGAVAVQSKRRGAS